MGIGLPLACPEAGLDMTELPTPCDIGDSEDVSWLPVERVDWECEDRVFDDGISSDCGVERVAGPEDTDPPRP